MHSCNGAPHSLVVWGCSYDDGVVVDEDSQVISVGGAPLDPHRVYVVGTARWEARSNKALHPYASRVGLLFRPLTSACSCALQVFGGTPRGDGGT